MTRNKYIAFGLTVLLVPGTFSIAQESHPQTETAHTRLIISFNSPGDGIDYKVKKQIDEYISSYERHKRVRLAKTTRHWGREGELYCCFTLSELSRDDQEQFVSRIQSLVKTSTRTLIVENAPCRNKGPS